MKKLFYYLLALPLALLVACGDDDDNNDNGNIYSPSVMHIAKIIEESQGTTFERMFTYDSEGRVVKMKTTVNSARDSRTYNSTYQYSDSLITCDEEVVGNGNLFSHIFTLENGRIVLDKVTDKGEKTFKYFKYNKDGCVVGYRIVVYNTDPYMPPYVYHTISWDNGNPSVMDYMTDNVIAWDYTDLPWKKGTFFEFDYSIIPETDPVLLGMGYYGELPKKLPSRYEKKLYEYNVSDSLVTKVTRTDSLQTERCVMNITWE